MKGIHAKILKVNQIFVQHLVLIKIRNTKTKFRIVQWHLSLWSVVEGLLSFNLLLISYTEETSIKEQDL